MILGKPFLRVAATRIRRMGKCIIFPYCSFVVPYHDQLWRPSHYVSVYVGVVGFFWVFVGGWARNKFILSRTTSLKSGGLLFPFLGEIFIAAMALSYYLPNVVF